MWTMLIVVLAGGTLSSNAAFQTINFENEAACTAAADVFRKGSSKTIGYFCISSQSGKVIKFLAE